MLVSHADGPTLLACIPFPNVRLDVTESHNRDISKIIARHHFFGHEAQPNQDSNYDCWYARSRIMFHAHSDLCVGSIFL